MSLNRPRTRCFAHPVGSPFAAPQSAKWRDPDPRRFMCSALRARAASISSSHLVFGRRHAERAVRLIRRVPAIRDHQGSITSMRTVTTVGSTTTHATRPSHRGTRLPSPTGRRTHTPLFQPRVRFWMAKNNRAQGYFTARARGRRVSAPARPSPSRCAQRGRRSCWDRRQRARRRRSLRETGRHVQRAAT